MPTQHSKSRRATENDHFILDLWTQVQNASTTPFSTGEFFRAQNDMQTKDKAQIIDDLQAMIRLKRKVEFALTKSESVEDQKDIEPEQYLLTTRVLCQKITPEKAKRQIPHFDWEAIAAIDTAIENEMPEVRRFALKHSLPDALAQELLNAYPSDANELMDGLNTKAPRTIRTNELSGDRARLLHDLTKDSVKCTATEHSKTGLHIEGWRNVFKLRAFGDGRFEVQDEASQLAAELVMPSAGMVVMDACAGAGGKTLALGAQMKNKGTLIAVDRNRGRLDELNRRARRAKLFCHRAIQADLTSEEPHPDLKNWLGKAARVLVDVPCTGIGAMRRKPEARWRFTLEELDRLAQQQILIARQAMRYCKLKGRLIYATCSVLPAENEQVVEQLLQDSNFQLIPIKELFGSERAIPLSDPDGRFMKLYPHKHQTDGFFAAVLRRIK